MKRLMLAVVLALLVLSSTAVSEAKPSSSKRVGHPPKHSTTTTSTTTTTAPPTTTVIDTNPLPQPSDLDRPNMPYDIHYEDSIVRWQMDGNTYSSAWLSLFECFYANGVSLCGDGIDYSRSYLTHGDYYAVLRPERFGGTLPRSILLSVQVIFGNGQKSAITYAPPVWQTSITPPAPPVCRPS